MVDLGEIRGAADALLADSNLLTGMFKQLEAAISIAGQDPRDYMCVELGAMLNMVACGLTDQILSDRAGHVGHVGGGPDA